MSNNYTNDENKLSLDSSLFQKLQKLESIVAGYSSVLVAFSGGVDSTLLACVCKRILGTNTLLVTANSSTYPKAEFNEAREIAALLDLPFEVIESEELNIPEFLTNPSNRCYYCKRELFSRLLAIAKERGIDVVFDGNNAGDAGDFRPGHSAAVELGIISPLEAAGFEKEEIRKLSRIYKLPTAEKPAMACLASRFPYGEAITREKLSRVEKAENEIRKLGFTQFRVRSHGDLARVEFVELELGRAFTLHKTIAGILGNVGFIYQCIDIKGYRTGSMNEVLKN